MPQPRHSAFRLYHGQLRLLKRYHRDSEQSLSIGRAVFGKPVVVSAKQRRRKLRMPDSSKPERVGGEQRRRVDALAIHYLKTPLAVGRHVKKIVAAGFCNEP